MDHRRGSRRCGEGDHPCRQVILSYAFLPGPCRAGTLPRGGAAPQSGAAHVTTTPSINSPPLALAPPHSPALRALCAALPAPRCAMPCTGGSAAPALTGRSSRRTQWRTARALCRCTCMHQCQYVRIAHWYRVGARVRISKSRPVLRSAFRRGRPCAPRAADRQSKLRSAALSAQRFRRAEDLPARARATRSARAAQPTARTRREGRRLAPPPVRATTRDMAFQMPGGSQAPPEVAMWGSASGVAPARSAPPAVELPGRAGPKSHTKYPVRAAWRCAGAPRRGARECRSQSADL